MKKVWSTPTVAKLNVSKTETGPSNHCEYNQPGNPSNGKMVGAVHNCPNAPS